MTFLFTDIVGSTPLWEQMPEAMRRAVALHHRLLRQVIEQHGGVVFKVIGDSYQAVFPLAGQAVSAAVAAQRALLTASWPTQTGPLKVRMGIHTGSAELEQTATGIDYAVSHTLNRVARIMAVGYGGQILLSREAADLVERDLPAQVSLRGLGEHQLKGLARLEHLFQVCAPGLQDDFPPLASGHIAPNNLPAQLTSFIGRKEALETLHRLITSEQSRLVTLTGPGGTGKTRLALQVASHAINSFTDGVWLVELAPLADPALVPLTIAGVLGLHETPAKTMTQRLVEYLGGKRLLLILDNCEHVVEAAAALAGTLLAACPHLQILATSREILGAMGESPYRVPSLELPGPQGEPLESLSNCESIRLFVDRARTAQPAFQLTEANAPVVTRICQRLDGIPLAIELAAARIRLLTVEQIAARLDDSFRLLTGGSRTVLSRHQTLRALIDWSYNLLAPAERTLFLRLSVFAGGFTLESAEHVCADPENEVDDGLFCVDDESDSACTLSSESILDLLSQLVDKSLVNPTEAPEDYDPWETGPETRYRMLETIRQYARDKLHDLGGGLAVRDRHLAYFLLLAEEAEPYLRQGDQVTWLDRLDAELDNLRLALEWSLARRVPEGLRLATALLWFWHIRGHGREGAEWLNHLLAAEQNNPPAELSRRRQLIRARALIADGFLSQYQVHSDTASPLLEEAIAGLRGLGATGRGWLGVALLFYAKIQRDSSQRITYMDEALPLLNEMGEPLYLAEYYMELGGFLMDSNQLDEATWAFLESQSYREQTQDLDGLGTAAMTLGDMALFRRDYAECERLYEKSLAYYQIVKNRTMESITLSRLGNIDMLTGNFSKAADRYAAGIAINQRTGDQWGIMNSLFDLGRLDLNIGELRRAGQYFSEVVRVSESAGIKHGVIVGLLFQGLSAQELGETDRAEDLLRQAIDYWRGVEKEILYPGFIASNLEIVAVLAARRHPEMTAWIFNAIDQPGLAGHDYNTGVEMAYYEAARAKAREALGADRFAEAQARGKTLHNMEEALAEVLRAFVPA